VLLNGVPVTWQAFGPSVLGYAYTALYNVGDPWSVVYGPDAILLAVGGNIIAAGGGVIEQ